MKNGYKPGGGNKPQPYIPKGNGEKSGEYTKKPVTSTLKIVKHCFIRNVKKKYNFKGSKLVEKVENVIAKIGHFSISITGKPNSVVKNIVDGYVVSERYYNNKGEAYLDIHYTCHGNPVTHPEVPHLHRWYKDEHGHLIRNNKWESFQWNENV